jgi:hypothetical protein
LTHRAGWRARARTFGQRAQSSRDSVLSDDRAAAYFVAESWVARALRAFEITVLIVELPKDLRKKVVDAQDRRGRKSRGK